MKKKDFQILVLDDEEIVLETTVQMLMAKGFMSVTACGDLMQSYPLLSEQTFQLILLDLHFGHLEGVGTLGQIRNGHFGPENQGAYVFILSGWVSHKAHLECEQLGANAIFNKPVDLYQLMDCVEQAYNEWVART